MSVWAKKEHEEFSGAANVGFNDGNELGNAEFLAFPGFLAWMQAYLSMIHQISGLAQSLRPHGGF